MFMKHSSRFDSAEKVALAGLDLGGPHQPVSAGVLAETRVETPSGWRPAGTLVPGVRVATFDGGFRPLAGLERRRLAPGAGRRIVHVPAGVMENCSAFRLLPGQHVFVASPAAEQVLDAVGALLPAAALSGHRGITLRPLAGAVDVLTLRFDDEELVYVQSGALVHCPAAGSRRGDGRVRSDFFEVLDETRGRAMLRLMTDATAAQDWRAVA